ncbi:CHASE3 domain-containing protein [Paenibacillus sp. GCM10023252]|uniref:CHASE3 domain-containing protein n=1 Tax=Paenibacillus sp. GCM10023252 TaxID=3252649 RepID=UPI00360A4249
MLFRTMKLDIRRKIILGYIFILVCLGVSVLVVVERITALQQEIDYVAEHDIHVHDLLNEIEKNIINMETGQRGYVITGDDRYLKPYEESLEKWEDNYNQVRSLLADNESQISNLEAIKPVIEHWISTAGEYTIQLRKNNQSQQLAEFFKQDSGKQDVDQIRVQISSLHDTERQLTKARIEQLRNSNNNLKITLYAVLLVVIIMAVFIALFISRNIVRTIRQVINAVQSMDSQEGSMASRIHVNTNDEVRELADATNLMLDSFERQSWTQTKIAEVATMYQGCNNSSELTSTFVEHLAPMIGSTYAAVYLKTEESGQVRYVKAASFAGKAGDIGYEGFKLGEGLIGQCAVDKRMYMLHDLPDNYVKISSGLGEAPPRHLLVAPIFYEEDVVAVVEFASLGSFESQHLALVDNLQGSLGVAINSVLGRMEIEKLLGESQMLTEELQAQSEELQAQSEELQMQQEQLRLTNDILEEQKDIAEHRADELERAKNELELFAEKLRESSQYKTDFLANMSHELRTPLNSILILSQLLYENENGTLTDEEEHYSRVINAAGQDLLTLIDDILDLSKIEAGKLEIVIDEVNMTELPHLMQPLFKPIAERRNIAFHTSIDDSVPNVMTTDGHRLQHILKNLLSNAFKFTEKGSVTMDIRSAAPERVSELFGQDYRGTVAAISVKDTGIGIPRDKQDIIFEAFQQVDGTTNRQFGGTGLGLSICRQFTRLLGGKLLLASEVGVGSTFTLYLPNLTEEDKAILEEEIAVQAVAAAGMTVADRSESEVLDNNSRITSPNDAIAAENLSKELMFKGKRILLVDDDARNVFALVSVLESKGMKVETANHGKECLDILERDSSFDLVLMDIMMPIMDGYEAMRAMRANEHLRELPIIALTAKAMKNDREKCLEAGASDYISKPLHMEQLFSLMRVWLIK